MGSNDKLQFKNKTTLTGKENTNLKAQHELNSRFFFIETLILGVHVLHIFDLLEISSCELQEKIFKA